MNCARERCRRWAFVFAKSLEATQHALPAMMLHQHNTEPLADKLSARIIFKFGSEIRLGGGTRDGRVNRDVPETTMSKTLLALAAATSITVSVLAASPAEARCKGCVVGAGVAASVATGFMVGSAIANTFFGVSIGTILAMGRLRRRLQSS
jgi:hypothetical protein